MTIRRCPLCDSIGGLSREAAAALWRIGGIELETADGVRGEFTVLVDGREILRTGDGLPSVLEVVEAVEDATLIGDSG